MAGYVARLNTYLFELPFPSLLPIVVALVFSRRFSRVERVLWTGVGIHGMLYFAYWHDGFFLGPRFIVPWIPSLVLAVGRFANDGAWRAWPPRARHLASGAAVAGVVMAATMYWMQKMTPMTTTDPAQQRMMMIMPVVFTAMFLNLPSGLAIYYLVNNLWGIGQQYFTTRLECLAITKLGCVNVTCDKLEIGQSS